MADSHITPVLPDHQPGGGRRLLVDGEALLEQLTYVESALTSLHAVSQLTDPTLRTMGAVAYLAGRLSDHVHDIHLLCEAANSRRAGR